MKYYYLFDGIPNVNYVAKLRHYLLHPLLTSGCTLDINHTN